MKRYFYLLILLFFSFSSHGAVATDSPLRMSIVTNDFVLPSKLTKLENWAEAQQITLTGVYIEKIKEQSNWLNTDLIIVDTPRGGDRVRVIAVIKSELDATRVPWVAVGGGPPLSGNLPPSVMHSLLAYYSAGGETNFNNMFAYIKAWQQQKPLDQIAKPLVMTEAGIYHYDSDGIFENWQDYLLWGKSRWATDAPVLAIAMSSSFISNSQTQFYDALANKIEQAGGIPLIFWFDRLKPSGIQDVIAEAKPVMLVNTTHMISGDVRQAEFQQLDIPVVIGLTSREYDIASWRQADKGIPAHTTAAMVTIPESWGLSDPLVLAALEEGEPKAIPEQLDLLVGRFMAMAKLKQQPAAQTRLALMFWNSPSGEKNLSASNLNIPRSIEEITQTLAEKGYKTTALSEQQIIDDAQAMLSGYYRPEQLMTLWQQGKAKLLPLTVYQQWLKTLPDDIQQKLLATWGEPENNWAIREIENKPQFVIPAIENDHLLWMPQPPRADKLGESTHDLKQVPGHLYLAAYLYLREQFTADALIHLGTHGTQEWTPGKDRGLWAYDYPNLAIGNVPVFYPYIQDNIGEALQAKRRGRATIISHQTPPYSPSGLYDELLEVHDLMHQYLQLEAGGVRDETQAQIIKKAFEFNLHTDLEWTQEQVQQSFGEFLPKLHDHIHYLAQATTPIGLHTFGQAAEQNLRIATVMQQLGEPFYEALGVDSKELFAEPFDTLFQQKPFTFLAAFIRGEQSTDTIKDSLLYEMVEEVMVNEQKLAKDGEMEALLHGLQGGFVAPGLGGDPVRQPDTTSGTNLYAFDPEKIPSKAAYDASETLYQSLVDDYQKQHDGQLPDKLAFTLWSSEAIRTYGLVESQVLRALGVKPEWDAAGRVTSLTIIPDTELSQPRVDAVLQITSVYRDQFDGLMIKLARVIEQLAEGDATINVIARNSQFIMQQLEKQGLSSKEARRFAKARLFSNPPGDYGSGVTGVAMDSTSWDDDRILADTFIQSQSHIYTTEDWGTPVQQLNLLQSQLQGTDAVVLSRSSNLHGMLSTDHPFEYLGGLSAVIKQIDGENPSLYVSDSRQRQARMTPASELISNELRTRYQNPQWIKAMQQEGYAGTVEMLKIVNNVFGWQVMDANMIRPDQWQALHETYVMDQRDLGLNEWFSEQNPTAQAQLIERMIEAIRKGYWQASEETREQLVARWQTLVNELGADKGADKTVEYIEQQLAGFGLNIAPANAQANSAESEQISGQVLQAQAEPEQQQDSPMPWVIVMLFTLLLAGALHRFYQFQQWNSNTYDR